MNKNKILVTGGAGFIGSNIVEELLRRKKNVVVLDNFSTGQMSHIRPFLSKINLVRGDIRDKKSVQKALRGVSIVIHQAAIRSVPKSVDNPFLSHEVNASGTLQMLEASMKAGVKRFVNASSSSVYGDVNEFPQRIGDPVKPLSPYGSSKLCAENYCFCYYDNFGFETISLRYFNVYGPRQNPESQYSAVVPAFIDKVRRGQKPIIDGTGKQSRDFTYVKDVVSANIRSAYASKAAVGRSFNVASGCDYSVNDILQSIAKFLKVKPEAIHGPRRRGDAMKTFAYITDTKRYLSWKPKYNLRQGLTETIKWFQDENPKLL